MQEVDVNVGDGLSLTKRILFYSGAAADDDSRFSSDRRVHMNADRRIVVDVRYKHADLYLLQRALLQRAHC